MTSSQTNQTTGHRFTAKTPEAYQYDLDGNLLQDGWWDYTWDAENRLIAMETRTNLSAATPRQRLVFTYDSQSRRITKTVYAYESEIWNQKSQIRFAYDAWNLVSEICYLPPQMRTISRSFAWGPDLSGTFQGAGGIGGLLASYSSALNVSHLTFYSSDGNGNVMALIDAGTLQPVAQYEYSPFGEVIRASGTQVKANPFQFSTKYCDGETGLDYYGYRYYQPEIGRWLSRDPMGERGGMHLYLSFRNSPLNIIDMLGMWGTSVHFTKTKEWASESFLATKALAIAEADEGVDSGATGPLPGQQQSRHLKYTLNGQDSRSYWYQYEYSRALGKLNEADVNNDSAMCSEAVAAFGRGLHSGQDISAHRPWPTGGDWHTLVIHPGWWDDWDVTNSTFPNVDVFWADYASSVGAVGGVYDKWRGSSDQIFSQANARHAVTQFSGAAISSFVADVKKSCVCKHELLRISLW